MILYHDDAVHCPILLLNLQSQIASDICTSDVLPPRLIGLNEFNETEGCAICEFQHAFEIPNLEVNLVKLHAPLNDKQS